MSYFKKAFTAWVLFMSMFATLLQAGTLSDASITLSDSTPGATSVYTVSFTTQTEIPTNNILLNIMFNTFPPTLPIKSYSTRVANCSELTIKLNGVEDSTICAGYNTSTAALYVNSSRIINAGTHISISIPGFTNPDTEGVVTPYLVRTTTPSGVNLDTANPIPTFTIEYPNRPPTITGAQGTGYTLAPVSSGDVDGFALDSTNNALVLSSTVLSKFDSTGENNTTVLSGLYQNGSPAFIDMHLFDIDSNDAIYTSNSTSLFRFNSDGSADTTFGTNGELNLNFLKNTPTSNPQPLYIKVDSNDKIVVGFYELSGNRPNNWGLVRFNSDGTLDTTFGYDGDINGTTDTLPDGMFDFDMSALTTANAMIFEVLEDEAHNIYTIASCSQKLCMVKANASGQYDTTFATNGVLYEEDLSLGVSGTTKVATTVDSNENVYIGTAINNAGDKDFLIRKYSSLGVLDTSFASNGNLTIDFGDTSEVPMDMVINATGDIVVVGKSGTSLAIASFDSNGSIKTSFGTNGKTVVSDVSPSYHSKVLIDTDGNYVVANAKGVVARLTSSGALDTTYGLRNAITITLAENNATVTTIAATDADNDTLSYSIGGIDSTLFEIDNATGILSFKTAPDYENPSDSNADNVYELTVSASDNDDNDTKILIITVTDANDIPEISSSAVTSVDQDSAYSYTLGASDADGDSLTWSVKDGTQLPSWLSIDNTSSFSKFTVNSDTILNPKGIIKKKDGNLYVLITDAGYMEVDKNGNFQKNLYRFYRDPYDIAINSQGDFYVTANTKIHKLDTNGNITDFSGTGSWGSVDGDASTTQFKGLTGIAIDSNDNLYVAEPGGNKIRKIDTNGASTTLTGTGDRGNDDGTLDTATFFEPHDIKIDSKGNLYVLDTNTDDVLKVVLRKIDISNNSVTTVFSSEYQDVGMAIDKFDNIYLVTNDSMGIVRKIDTNNNVSVIAHIGEHLRNITVDGTDLYVTESNYDVYKIEQGVKLTGTPTASDIGDHNITLVLSDGTNEVEHNFTITVKGDAPSVSPTISKGTSDGTTKITYTPSNGNSLKYMYSNTSVTTPQYGSDAPLSALNYTSGTNIENAESGKYLAVYEVDSEGKIVGFYQKELVSDDIYTTPTDPTDPEPETPSNSSTAQQCVEKAITSITFDSFKGENSDQQFINEDLNLTTSVTTDCGDMTITWKSSDTTVITNEGDVTASNEAKTISLTATVSYEDEVSKKLFLLTVRDNSISDADILKTLVFDKIKKANTKQKEIVSSLDLISTLMSKNIMWSSTPVNIILNDGNVTRDVNDVNVTLTATIGSESKEFNLTVLAQPNNDAEKLAKDKEWLSYAHILGKNKDNTNVEYNLVNPLPTTAPNGSTITWESGSTSNPKVMEDDGTIARDANGDKYVVLTATFTQNGQTVTKEFIFKILQQKPQEDIGTTFTKVVQEDSNTTVEVQDENNVTKSTTVEFSTGVSFERTIDEESVKQTVEFEDKKLDIYLNTDGSSQSNAEFKDENNNTVISSVQSKLPGTQTTVDSTGKIISTISIDTGDVNASINEDGSVEHIVKLNSSTKPSRATSKVKGSSTVVNSDGSVETSSQTIESGFIIKAVVTTNSQGQSSTKFVKENIATGVQTDVANTMNPNTPYPVGNEVTIDTIGTKLFIKTVAPLVDDLEVE